jgi:hypothetical protein
MARVFRSHWRWSLMALVLAGLAARVAWIASHTESGWETIASDWRGAAIGQFVGRRLPVAQRDSAAQTDFWLLEIDRILQQDHKSPDLMLGAARMLGSYMGDYHTPISADLAEVPDLDVSSDGRNYRSYGINDRERRAKRLQLATAATVKFPASPSAWQTLAEIASEYTVSADGTPESSDWQKVLDDGKTHDPGNSLYDFLAANRMLIEANQMASTDDFAISQGNSPTEDVLQKHRQAEIEVETAAIEHIKHGLGLPKFEIARDKSSIYKLIDSTNLPWVEKAHLAAWSETGHFSTVNLVFALNDCITRMGSREPKVDTVPIRRLALKLCDLDAALPIADPIERWRYDSVRAEQWRQWASFLSSGDLNAPVSEEASPAQRTAIDLETRRRVWTSAVTNWNQRQQTGPQFNNTWIGYTAWKAAAISVQLVLIALIAGALWQIVRLAISKPSEFGNIRLGMFRQLLAWIVSLGICVTVFALAPAEIIGHAVQGWIATLLFLLAIVGLPIAVAILLKGRISIWTLLAFTIGYTVIFFQLYLWDATDINRPLRQIPPAFWMPAHGADGMSADQLQSMRLNRAPQSALTSRPLRWPALQWVLYHGAEWTLAGALVGIGIWWWLRANRERKRAELTTGVSDTKRRRLVPGLMLAVARAAIGAAVVALAIYLSLAPERIEHFEAIYQFESQQVQDPDGHLAPLQKRFDELAAEEQKTGAIRKQVEREFGNADDSQ